MFPFDVILFDIGGVLLTNGWDTAERAVVVERFGLNHAEFDPRHQAAYPAWERGETPLKSYLDETVFYTPRSFSPDEFFAAMCEGSRVLADGALPVLKELAQAGPCLVGALNNEARETNEYRLQRFGLRALFKVTLSSCYLGLRKPDHAIYQRALDILGRPAQRILFIDDRESNVAAAAGVGFKAVRFLSESQLRQELAAMKVS